MKEATFQIPLRDNEGRKFTSKTLERIQEDILDRFPGYTVRETKGAWRGQDNKTYIDENLEYTVVTDEEGAQELVRWLGEVKKLLRQEAMFLTVTETEAKLI